MASNVIHPIVQTEAEHIAQLSAAYQLATQEAISVLADALPEIMSRSTCSAPQTPSRSPVAAVIRHEYNVKLGSPTTLSPYRAADVMSAGHGSTNWRFASQQIVELLCGASGPLHQMHKGLTEKMLDARRALARSALEEQQWTRERDRLIKELGVASARASKATPTVAKIEESVANSRSAAEMRELEHEAARLRQLVQFQRSEIERLEREVHLGNSTRKEMEASLTAAATRRSPYRERQSHDSSKRDVGGDSSLRDEWNALRDDLAQRSRMIDEHNSTEERMRFLSPLRTLNTGDISGAKAAARTQETPTRPLHFGEAA